MTFARKSYICFIFRCKSFKWIIDKEAKNELWYLFLWLRSQVKTTKRCGIRNSLANLNSLQIPVGRLWERRGNEQIYFKHNIICSINNLSNVSNDVKMVKNVIFNEKILENYQNRSLKLSDANRWDFWAIRYIYYTS